MKTLFLLLVCVGCAAPNPKALTTGLGNHFKPKPAPILEQPIPKQPKQYHCYEPDYFANDMPPGPKTVCVEIKRKNP
jgi:hypothetical protein